MDGLAARNQLIGEAVLTGANGNEDTMRKSGTFLLAVCMGLVTVAAPALAQNGGHMMGDDNQGMMGNDGGQGTMGNGGHMMTDDGHDQGTMGNDGHMMGDDSHDQGTMGNDHNMSGQDGQ
jgi:hypothetical protein